MKKIAWLILLLLIFSFTQINTMQQLQRLQGSWYMKTAKGIVGESWTVANNNLMQSKAYSVVANDTTLYETVSLENKNGAINYTVIAANQNNEQPVSFKLTSSINNSFVFENKQHDYPKRIVYTFINNDSILAYVDDGIEQSTKRNYFYYSRVK